MQAKIYKEKELEAALQRLRGKNTDISHEAADIKVTFWVYMRVHLFYNLN